MKKNKDIKWLLLILLVTIILLFPLFFNKRLYGHDTLFHTGNIIYLSKTISIANILGDNIIKLKNYPFGYGTWLFYPKLPHLLGAYIYLICKNIYLSMKIIYFITTFLSGVIIFYLSKKLFSNKKVAFLSSITYLTYSYHLCEIYIRDAYAENFMFIIIPLIFLGLLELKDNNYKKFYIFFITGYVIGMYSHLISMFFCTFFVSLFLIYYRKIFFTKDKLTKILISTIIVTNLTLPFLTTIVEHKLLGNYVIFTDAFSSKTSTTINTVTIDKYFNHNKEAIYNNILIYINYITVALILITTIIFFLKKYRNKYKDERKLLFFSALICIALINSKWLWNNLPSIFSTIQFPWRITVILSLIISLYASLCFITFNKYSLVKTFLYIMSILFTMVEGTYNICFFGPMEYNYQEIINSGAIMGWQAEYLPQKTLNYRNKLLSDNIELLLDERKYHQNDYKIQSSKNIKIKIIEDNNKTLKFKLKNIKEKTTINIPRTYYLGYELIDNHKEKYPLKEGKNGFLETSIYKNGTYTLKYKGTVYEKISRLICTITILIGGFKLWKRKQ